MNATMWLIAGVLSLVIGGSAAAITMRINGRANQHVGALRGGFFIAAVAVTVAGLIALAYLPDVGHAVETIALATLGALAIGATLDLVAASNVRRRPPSQAKPRLIEHNEQDSYE